MSNETIYLGGGCFWCIEALFRRVRGVEEVESGYSGGTTAYPTAEQVYSGTTNHAEVVKVVFNPEVVSLHDLLTMFFTLHDPTTLNRQGADVGTEYRSVIFYTSGIQRETAQRVMEEISSQGVWDDPLVTQLEPFSVFYPAEEYNQNFFEKYTNAAYCQIVIAPKVAKLRKLYIDKLVQTEED